MTTQSQKWSARDEAQLQELVARCEKVMAENRTAVSQLVSAVTCGFDIDVGKITTEIVQRADDFIDALRPFDSGIRKG